MGGRAGGPQPATCPGNCRTSTPTLPGLEREQGYKYPHNYRHHWVRQQYLPDAIKNAHYYDYGDNKTEQAARAYWDKIKGPVKLRNRRRAFIACRGSRPSVPVCRR